MFTKLRWSIQGGQTASRPIHCRVHTPYLHLPEVILPPGRLLSVGVYLDTQPRGLRSRLKAPHLQPAARRVWQCECGGVNIHTLCAVDAAAWGCAAQCGGVSSHTWRAPRDGRFRTQAVIPLPIGNVSVQSTYIDASWYCGEPGRRRNAAAISAAAASLANAASQMHHGKRGTCFGRWDPVFETSTLYQADQSGPRPPMESPIQFCLPLNVWICVERVCGMQQSPHTRPRCTGLAAGIYPGTVWPCARSTRVDAHV
eukprot:366155-Chlamydomonas_euryale.AAC.8